MGTETRERIVGTANMEPWFDHKPPQAWDQLHRRAETASIHFAHRVMEPAADNRPVPRQASCHYYHTDTDPLNFYFY